MKLKAKFGIRFVPLLVWNYGFSWGSFEHENETRWKACVGCIFHYINTFNEGASLHFDLNAFICGHFWMYPFALDFHLVLLLYTGHWYMCLFAHRKWCSKLCSPLVFSLGGTCSVSYWIYKPGRVSRNWVKTPLQTKIQKLELVDWEWWL